mmetsp:Transcript_22435/g.64430  ORF Transcript_22435/g.64430 Transcript_22435/m.64430 type:complete len:227 (-) Transcript_22435:68-748(-)
MLLATFLDLATKHRMMNAFFLLWRMKAISGFAILTRTRRRRPIHVFHVQGSRVRCSPTNVIDWRVFIQQVLVLVIVAHHVSVGFFSYGSVDHLVLSRAGTQQRIQLEWVDRCLATQYRRGSNRGGLSFDEILSVWNRKVLVVTPNDVHGSSRASGHPREGYAVRIDVPVVCMMFDKFNGADGIVNRSRQRNPCRIVRRKVSRKPIIYRSEADAVLEEHGRVKISWY